MRNLALLAFMIWSILWFRILWEFFPWICQTFSMQAVYVLFRDDGGMKLPYFIAIGGFVCAIFAIGIPHLSALGIWLGFSTCLSLIYIVTAFVLSLTDGKISNWMLGLGTTSYCMVSMMICTLKDKAKSNFSKLQFTSFYGQLVAYYKVNLLVVFFLPGAHFQSIKKINNGIKMEKENLNMERGHSCNTFCWACRYHHHSWVRERK